MRRGSPAPHTPPAGGPCLDEHARAAERLSHGGWATPPMTRWRLAVEYAGGPFMGWQRQDHGPSVQEVLEQAIFRMTGELATLHAAGRTDAGVHALAMVAHVDVVKQLT